MPLADRERVRRVFEALRPVLSERLRRLVAAAQAQALGHRGVALVAEVTGLARSTITQGTAELTAPPVAVVGAERLRRPGGGRKPLIEPDPTLVRDLEALVEPTIRGDPESPLRWTCKSLSKLVEALDDRGHRISGRKVGDLLRDLGYRLQANRKAKEGASHPDRNAQFVHINAQALAFQQRVQPVISVDTKKRKKSGRRCRIGAVAFVVGVRGRPGGAAPRRRNRDHEADDHDSGHHRWSDAGKRRCVG